MKMSKKLRFAALAMSVVMLFVTVPAFAVQEEASGIAYNLLYSDEGVEFIEIMGLYYHFNDTYTYTTVLQINPSSGEVVAYHNCKQSDILTRHVQNLNQRVAVFSSDASLFDVAQEISASISNGEIVSSDVVNNIILDSGLYHEADFVEPFGMTPFNISNAAIVSALRGRGHVQRGFSNIGAAQVGNFTGQVHENTTFSQPASFAFWVFAAGTAAVTISAALGVQMSTIVRILVFVPTGIAGIYLAHPATVNRQTVTVTYLRQGRVNGVTMLSPGRMLQYVIYTGNTSEGFVRSLNWDSSDFLFHDVRGIAQEAVRLFRLQTGQ